MCDGLVVKPVSSKGERPSWKPTYGKGFESQAHHSDGDVDDENGNADINIEDDNNNDDDEDVDIDQEEDDYNDDYEIGDEGNKYDNDNDGKEDNNESRMMMGTMLWLSMMIVTMQMLQWSQWWDDDWRQEACKRWPTHLKQQSTHGDSLGGGDKRGGDCGG